MHAGTYSCDITTNLAKDSYRGTLVIDETGASVSLYNRIYPSLSWAKCDSEFKSFNKKLASCKNNGNTATSSPASISISCEDTTYGLKCSASVNVNGVDSEGCGMGDCTPTNYSKSCIISLPVSKI